MTSAEDFIRMVEEKNRLIDALVEYTQALEWALKEARGEKATEEAFTKTDREISELRYEHGLRAGRPPTLR